MRIIGFLILFILTGCNSEYAKLSPLGNIIQGLHISSVSNRSSNINTTITIPFQISDSETRLSCTTSVSYTNSNGALYTAAGINISGSAPNCVLTLTPATGVQGLANFVLNVTNGANTASTSFTVHVAAQVPPAVADFGAVVSFNEDTEHFITLPYTDANGDLATSCSIVSALDPLIANISTPCSCDASGVCSVGLTGATNVNGGPHLVTFTVTDNDGTSNTASFSFTLIAVNDPPTISAIADFSATSVYAANHLFTYQISDPESALNCVTNIVAQSSNTQMLQHTRLTKSANGANCELSINALPNTIGTTTITLTVSDGSLTATETFNYTLTGWGQVAYIKAANSGSDDYYATKVSLDGNYLAVGAYWEDSNQSTITNGTTASSNTSDSNSGAAYIYKRTGSTWAQEAYIKANNPDIDDNFGRYISLSQDTLVVGAPYEDSNQTTITATGSSDDSRSSSGAVYVFRRTGSSWAQEAYLKASNAAVDDYFGYSVSLKGNTLVVGAAGTDSGGFSSSGTVYVYQRTGTTWSQAAILNSANPTANDSFGYSVSMGENLLAIGVPFEDSNATTINGSEISNASSESGAVYIFEWDGSGWFQEAFIKAPNNNSDDRFGYSVSIDGNKLAVGAIYEDGSPVPITDTIPNDNSTSDSGAVYVFERSSLGVWSLEAFIKGDFTHPMSNFGYSVSLKGETLVVGTIEDYSQNYIINGTSSPISTGGGNYGSAYVYRFDGSVWSHEAYLKPSNAGTDDQFGYTVSISGDTIAVGAPFEDGNETTIRNDQTAHFDENRLNSGAVYIFQNNARLFEVTEVWAQSDDEKIIINWHQTGGTATEYWIERVVGTGTPPACDNSLRITSNSQQSNGLLDDTDYTFRLCASDGTTSTPGKVFTVRTKTDGSPLGSAIAVDAN